MSQQDYFIEFARELGTLNGNIEAVLKRLEKGEERMAQHEARLSLIEGKMRGQASTSTKPGSASASPSADGTNGVALPRWAVYVIVGLLAALLGALGVKIPGVM